MEVEATGPAATNGVAAEKIAGVPRATRLEMGGLKAVRRLETSAEVAKLEVEGLEVQRCEDPRH